MPPRFPRQLLLLLLLLLLTVNLDVFYTSKIVDGLKNWGGGGGGAQSNFPTRDHQNIFNLSLTFFFFFFFWGGGPYERSGYEEAVEFII